MPFPFSMYRKRIIEIAKCSEDEATLIEAMMRDIYSTLDGLSAATFKREVKKAMKTITAEAAAENALEAKYS